METNVLRIKLKGPIVGLVLHWKLFSLLPAIGAQYLMPKKSIDLKGNQFSSAFMMWWFSGFCFRRQISVLGHQNNKGRKHIHNHAIFLRSGYILHCNEWNLKDSETLANEFTKRSFFVIESEAKAIRVRCCIGKLYLPVKLFFLFPEWVIFSLLFRRRTALINQRRVDKEAER